MVSFLITSESRQIMKIDRKDYEKSIANDGGIKNENAK